MKLTIPYFGSVFALLVLDFLWIVIIMADFYEENIGHLMGDGINWFAAGLFYLLYVAGVFIFAVLPSVRAGKLRRAATLGGLLGLIAFGTYDLTNMATIADWPFVVTVVDMLWGTFLTAVLASLGFLLVRAYNKPKSEDSIPGI